MFPETKRTSPAPEARPPQKPPQPPERPVRICKHPPAMAGRARRTVRCDANTAPSADRPRAWNTPDRRGSPEPSAPLITSFNPSPTHRFPPAPDGRRRSGRRHTLPWRAKEFRQIRYTPYAQQMKAEIGQMERQRIDVRSSRAATFSQPRLAGTTQAE